MCLLEFAPAGANKIQYIFGGGVYVAENTSRLANVLIVPMHNQCAAASRNPFKREPSKAGLV